MVLEPWESPLREGKIRLGLDDSKDDWWRWFDDDLIAGHVPAPRPIAPGDSVHWPVSDTGTIKATVVAIDGGEAWIRNICGHRTILPVASLRHYE